MDRVTMWRLSKVAPGVTLHGYSWAEVSDLSGVDTGPETMVQQHFRDEVDVNTIVRRFGLSSDLPAAVNAGVYGDFTGIEDYASAVAAIDRAHEGFMRLPAQVREKFDNDPGRLISAAHSMSEADFLSAFAEKVQDGQPAAPAGVVELPDGSSL